MILIETKQRRKIFLSFLLLVVARDDSTFIVVE
ncbi:uncharacterized protein METZ01_LOCUS25038 [marine metagenome]|uniref:Uncharacterized protein n=1 Tax=marine metagenome TaxID=408172 RepID=A0A381PZX7_9ZZZZ